tara:strand:- start:1960 stop:2148 length:189 start_codon:yes stop_codon:yes gene_type:complete
MSIDRNSLKIKSIKKRCPDKLEPAEKEHTISPCRSMGRAADSLERWGGGSIPSKDVYRKEKK